jgi:hypothetical protein
MCLQRPPLLEWLLWLAQHVWSDTRGPRALGCSATRRIIVSLTTRHLMSIYFTMVVAGQVCTPFNAHAYTMMVLSMTTSLNECHCRRT